jgi:GT2 family glycosyltransferase
LYREGIRALDRPWFGTEIMPQPLVTIVIPVYNQYGYTRRCLESVRGLDYKEVETLVVDNGSRDGTSTRLAEEFPWVRVIRSETNLGYAGGCNRGMREARGEYILLLNNDTWIVDRDLLTVLARTLGDDPRIAAVGPRIVDYDDPSRILFDGERDAVGFLDIAGVVLLLRRSSLEEVGLFDESFFAYYEDRDLFARVRKAGWSLRHVPTVRVAHKGSATAVSGSAFYYRWHNRNLVVFLRRYATLRNLLLRVLPTWTPATLWSLKSLLGRHDREGLQSWIRGYWEGIRCALADQPTSWPSLPARPP